MACAWRVAQAAPAAARALGRALGLHPVTAQLLLNRGIRDRAQAAQFLAPQLSSLSDPARLRDMRRAVSRIRLAISRREPIIIFGDSDVDGLTASIILYEALRELGGRVSAVQSNRLADGYGLPQALVRKLCRAGAALVILVDCGTNQPEEILRLAERGIDTIIVDHHVPLRRRAAPLALVNPHADGGLGQELCSAGLAFKMAQALFDAGAPGRISEYLDLAALGTLADCGRLLGENRVLVAEGLPRIARSARPGLQRLCEATRVTAPEPEQIVRRLIPRLNAGGRLGEADTVWKLLLSEQDERLDARLTASASAHAELKQLHRRTLAEAHEQVNRLHFKDQYVLLVSRTGWPQGLMGPVAAQLAQRYSRPAIAVAMADRLGVGSGRSIPVFNLLAAVQACEPWLVRFGGHAQACGLTIDRQHLEMFRGRINEEAARTLGRSGLSPTRLVDLELGLHEIEMSWVGEVERLKPFGHGNPKPTVLVRRVQLEAASARTGMITDGRARCAVRGTLEEIVRGGWYDAVLSPAAVSGGLALTPVDAKAAAAP